MSDWSVFPNGSSYMMWRDRNCDRCRKDFDTATMKTWINTLCPIEQAISLSSVLDGKIEEASRPEIGKRLEWDGATYLEHDCPEFEPDA